MSEKESANYFPPGEGPTEDEQAYYQAVDIARQRFLKALEELFDEHHIKYRLMAGEIDLLGDGFRFTPWSLFEALEERGM
jgi:hypothetical protein